MWDKRYRLSAHPTFSHPGCFVRLHCPIVLILLSAVDRLRNNFPVGDAVAPQPVGHDLPRLRAMVP